MAINRCEDNTTYIPGQKKIVPAGTIEITENGEYDVAQYASANVNVSGGGGDDSFAKTVDRSIVTANIPSSVKSIGNNAFRECKNLINAIIPSGVTSIGNNAFNACESLRSINISGDVTNIGRSAFYGCSSLPSIIIPSGVTTLEVSTFDDCFSLEDVTILGNVTSIGSACFRNNAIKNFTILATTPPTITGNVFYNVPSNANIYVPAESVEAYKTASYWSARANYIQAIQE